MRRILIMLGVIAASLGIAPAAFGACAGTQNTVVICVEPTGQTIYSDCVYYVIKPGCIPVSVPGPTIQCGGNIGEKILSCM